MSISALRRSCGIKENEPPANCILQQVNHRSGDEGRFTFTPSTNSERGNRGGTVSNLQSRGASRGPNQDAHLPNPTEVHSGRYKSPGYSTTFRSTKEKRPGPVRICFRRPSPPPPSRVNARRTLESLLTPSNALLSLSSSLAY